MDAVAIILLLAAMAALIPLVVGLAWPRLVLRGAERTRKKVLKVYASAFLICGTGGVIANAQTEEYKAQVAAKRAEKARVAAEAAAAKARQEAEAQAAAERAHQEQLAAEAATLIILFFLEIDDLVHRKDAVDAGASSNSFDV